MNFICLIKLTVKRDKLCRTWIFIYELQFPFFHINSARIIFFLEIELELYDLNSKDVHQANLSIIK